MTGSRFATAALALALTPAVIGLTSGSSADAASYYYSSCAKLNKAFPHGVAKGAAAASYQVRQGYGRPSTSTRAKKVYATNYKRLDRDKDGTACER